MERGFDGERGGIAWLAGIVRQYGEPIEFDLIERGLRLRWLATEQLTWADLRAIVRNLPPGSALSRAVAGPGQYTVAEVLQLATVNVLRGMSWQLGGDSKAARPEPLMLPGIEHNTTDTEGWRGKPVTSDEMRKRLGW